MNRLGDLLEAERARRDLTLTEFAERVLGISHAMVSRYVNGVTQPSRRTVRKIAAALDRPASEIDALVADATVSLRKDDESGSLSPDDDSAPRLAALASVHFYGLVSELGSLTDAERAAVLPVLREIVGRRRRGRSDAGGGGTGAGGPV